MSSFDPLSLSASLAYVEDLEARHRQDPSSIDPTWRALLENGHATVAPPGTATGAAQVSGGVDLAKAYAVFSMITEFRMRGHLEAKLDPLGIWKRPPVRELDPAHWGLSGDMDKAFPVGDYVGEAGLSLGELVKRLRATDCASIGVQFMSFQEPERRDFL